MASTIDLDPDVAEELIAAIRKLLKFADRARRNANGLLVGLSNDDEKTVRRLDSEIRGLQSQCQTALPFPPLGRHPHQVHSQVDGRGGFTEFYVNPIGLCSDFADTLWRQRLKDYSTSLRVVTRALTRRQSQDQAMVQSGAAASVNSKGLRLSLHEEQILNILRDTREQGPGKRMTKNEIVSAAAERKIKLSDGQTKHILSGLVKLGLIDNKTERRSRGYSLVS